MNMTGNDLRFHRGEVSQLIVGKNPDGGYVLEAVMDSGETRRVSSVPGVTTEFATIDAAAVWLSALGYGVFLVVL
jgi:hypothetical protein